MPRQRNQLTILQVLLEARARDPLSALDLEDLADRIGIPSHHLRDEIAETEQRGYLATKYRSIGTRNFCSVYLTKDGVQLLEPETPVQISKAVSGAEEIASLERQLDELKRNVLTIEEKKAVYVDPRSAPPDLEEAERLTGQKIADIVARLAGIEGRVESPDGRQTPVGPSETTLEDLMCRLHEMDLNLGDKLNDLKRGQAVIYQRISASDRGTLEAIRTEIRQGRVEQGQMENTLDAIRRTLQHVQEVGLPVADEDVKQSLADIYRSVNSDLDFRQQLELSLPVIPFLLQYRVGFEAGVDLREVWKELASIIGG